MTLYLFGGFLVDADSIIGAVHVGDKGVETRVHCRGTTDIFLLQGATKAAFDSWAQSIEPFLLKASEPDLATVHSHMHPCGKRADSHIHPHEIGHHHGGERIRPGSRDYSGGDTQ